MWKDAAGFSTLLSQSGSPGQPPTHPPRITQKPPGSTWNDRQEKWLTGSYLCDCGLHSQESIQGTAILVKADFSWKLQRARVTGATESTNHIPPGLPGWLHGHLCDMGRTTGEISFRGSPFLQVLTPSSTSVRPCWGLSSVLKDRLPRMKCQNFMLFTKRARGSVKLRGTSREGGSGPCSQNHWPTFLHSFEAEMCEHLPSQQLAGGPGVRLAHLEAAQCHHADIMMF